MLHVLLVCLDFQDSPQSLRQDGLVGFFATLASCDTAAHRQRSRFCLLRQPPRFSQEHAVTDAHRSKFIAVSLVGAPRRRTSSRRTGGCSCACAEEALAAAHTLGRKDCGDTRTECSAGAHVAGSWNHDLSAPRGASRSQNFSKCPKTTGSHVNPCRTRRRPSGQYVRYQHHCRFTRCWERSAGPRFDTAENK